LEVKVGLVLLLGVRRMRRYGFSVGSYGGRVGRVVDGGYLGGLRGLGK